MDLVVHVPPPDMPGAEPPSCREKEQRSVSVLPVLASGFLVGVLHNLCLFVFPLVSRRRALPASCRPAGRREIFAVHTGRMALDGAVDLDALASASDGFTGARACACSPAAACSTRLE